jgi:hypothetical protein
MATRSVVPLLVLAIVGVLTVGAVVLGLEQAPATADLLVHNAAGELIAAPSFTAQETVGPKEYVRLDYTAPDHFSESLITSGRVEKMIRLKATQVPNALATFGLVGVKGLFKAKGSEFVASEPAADLYPAADRSRVKGTAKFVVKVRTGYVVDEDESIRVIIAGGTDRSAGGDLVIKRIGGQAVGGS